MRSIFGRVPPLPIRPCGSLPLGCFVNDSQAEAEANARWALHELGSIQLGDLRSNRRMVKVLSQMLNSPGQSILQCSPSIAEAKAFYRLLDVEELTESLLLEVHQQAVLRRAMASGCRVLLAIQDTTTCNYDTHHALEGLGAISSNQNRADFQGLHVHSTLLTAADEDEVFGLLGAKIYARKALRKKQTPGTRNRERIEDKESIRWIEGLEQALHARQKLQEAAAAAQGIEAPVILSVGDREADIYELMVEAQQHREQGLGLLVRSQHNRALAKAQQDEQEGEETLMWSRLAQSQPAGSHTLHLPRSQGQKARGEVTLSVRFSRVSIAVPKHKAKYQKMDTVVEASIVELREENAPKGKGICWRLLSTLEVDTLEAAIQLARWYAKRWQIEEFHRILKTGCRVEERQLRSLERLKPMMALDMIVACRIMGMSAGARQRPESPATDWLDEDEIEALEAYENHGKRRAKNASPMTLGCAVRSIGKLGGHLGRKGDGHPGAQVLWRGLGKLDVITEVWSRFRNHQTCG